MYVKHVHYISQQVIFFSNGEVPVGMHATYRCQNNYAFSDTPLMENRTLLCESLQSWNETLLCEPSRYSLFIRILDVS